MDTNFAVDAGTSGAGPAYAPVARAGNAAVALKQSPEEAELREVTEALGAELGHAEPAAAPKATTAEKRSLARMKGYTGEACTECGNFTLVRNGTCLKCDTCGGTSGCS